MLYCAGRSAERSLIRKVIYFGDFDGGFDRMSEQDERDSGAHAPSGRKMAGIPSLRPGPRERRMSRQRWAVAFGATAAAVALIVVVAVPFATRARPPATPPRTAHAAATQTASAQALAAAAALGPVVAVSMDSPTDGWAISQL